MSPTKRTAKSAASEKSYDGFTEDERDAMKERAKELKATSRRGAKEQDNEPEVLAKIAEMSPGDRDIAERLHKLIRTNAPHLAPRLWYGQPAYARDGKVVCFFQPSEKFKTRYSTLGFSDQAHLDDGAMWPSAYALTKLTAADEKKIVALVKKAAG